MYKIMPKAKASKSKKSAPKTVEPSAPTPSPTQQETAPKTVFETMKYSEEFDKIFAQLQGMKTIISQVITDTKKIQKNVQKDIKSAERKQQRAGSKKGKREPSGFAKPAVISNELCDFLGKPYGTEMARTEVTKYLTAYIKDHNLQQPQDKRRINPDKKLLKLLKLSKDDQVTYFNLQKWMKPHFPTSMTANP